MPQLTLSFVISGVDTIVSDANQITAVVLTMTPNPSTSVASHVVSGEFDGDITLTINGPGPLLASYARRFKEDQVYYAEMGNLPRIDPTSLSVEEIEALSQHEGVLEALSLDE